MMADKESNKAPQLEWVLFKSFSGDLLRVSVVPPAAIIPVPIVYINPFPMSPPAQGG